MVKATHKHKEKVAWGEIEVYQAVEYDGDYYRLYEHLTLTVGSTSYTGEIVSITESTIDFMTKDRHFKVFNLSDITSIHY